MNLIRLLLCLTTLVIVDLQGLPALNNNGPSAPSTTNGKPTDEVYCRADDGRIEIPINGRLRLGVNNCRTCICTVTGFICDEQCETTPASTSTETTTLSTTPVFAAPNDQGTVNNSAAPLPPPNPASNVAVGIITAPTVSSNAQPDNETSKTNPPGPCPVGFADKLASIRDYAFMDCSEVYLSGKRTSGTYEIWPRTSPKSFRVYCDMETDGGGWTVIQRRGDYSQQSNFFVNWASYKRGFGDLSRDFWLGNDKIHVLTNQDEYRLHIDLADFNEQTRFADYEWFFITDERTKYTLNLGRYLTASTGGDSLSYNRGMRFTTRDQDNDHSMTSQCAENYRSGWWHTGCTLANLNGHYLRGNDSTATGVFWNNWLGAKYSLKSCEMKIRPIGFNAEMLS